MQELLRHSSLRSTLDVYTQAITPSKSMRPGAPVMSLVMAADKLQPCRQKNANVGLSEINRAAIWGGVQGEEKKEHKGTQICVLFVPSVESAYSK